MVDQIPMSARNLHELTKLRKMLNVRERLGGYERSCVEIRKRIEEIENGN